MKDLIATYLQAGGDLRFETPALGVSALTSSLVIHTSSGDIACDLVAGCDGFYGITLPSLEVTA